MTKADVKKSWKHAASLQGALHLVNLGVILDRIEAKSTLKAFTAGEIAEIVKHVAVRLGDRVGNRLAEEILVESLLHLLVNQRQDELLGVFLEELLLHPNHKLASFSIAEIALSSEFEEDDYGDRIFAMAVALVCELGVFIAEYELQYPGELKDAGEIVHFISTYLLSLSNNSDQCIRLSLVRYFGIIEKGDDAKLGFNRIMERFGHTVLETLFKQLFNKKTESVALQFMLANIIAILEADNRTQTILHDTMRYYMLKKPSRFVLFMKALTRYLKSQNRKEAKQAILCFLKHLGVLAKVASDLNHRELGKEIFNLIEVFRTEPFRDELIRRIRLDSDMRPMFVDMLNKIIIAPKINRVNNEGVEVNIPGQKISSKRGRRPSFSKKEQLAPIDQVYFLGQKHTERAS